MKWEELKVRSPDLYPRVRELCDEIHQQQLAHGGLSAEFCNHCHTLHGWYCFPCNHTKKLYRERYGEKLEEKIPRQSPRLTPNSISWNGLIYT